MDPEEWTAASGTGLGINGVALPETGTGPAWLAVVLCVLAYMCAASVVLGLLRGRRSWHHGRRAG